MKCEFVGSFSDDERRRIEDALRHVDDTHPLGTLPDWAIFNTKNNGVPFFYMAVSHRATRGRSGLSFHGETVDALITAIYSNAPNTRRKKTGIPARNGQTPSLHGRKRC
jgi:hypothetical protein